MITATSRFSYRPSSGEWNVYTSAPSVCCDREGCAAKATPTGLEYNGGRVERIYGCDGWYLGVVDLCPDHAPKSLDEPCVAAEDGAHDIRNHYDGDEGCDLCGLYRKREELTP